MDCGMIFFIIVVLIIVIGMIVFIIKTKGYSSTEGVIVDYKTEKRILNNSFYFEHEPIIEYMVDGKRYRIVRSYGYKNYTRDWSTTRLNNYIGTELKLKYDPTNPHRCYTLLTIPLIKVRIIYNIPKFLFLILGFIMLMLFMILLIKK